MGVGGWPAAGGGRAEGDASFLTTALRRLAGTVERYGSGSFLGMGAGCGYLLPDVERAAAGLIGAGERVLMTRLRPAPAPAPVVELPAGGSGQRLTREQVIALLGDEWDGDDDDEVPVIVDAFSNLSIS